MVNKMSDKFVHSIKAFSDSRYEYYRLTKNLGNLEKGAIFYHDPDDCYFGSPAQGCIKLCWTPDGNCYRYCGGAVIFHYDFVDSDLFERADKSDICSLIDALRPGKYELVVESNGDWNIKKRSMTIDD